MPDGIDLTAVFSTISFCVTCYFWLIRARRDRPNLEFLQLSDFRASCRRCPEGDGKRLCLQQLDAGGVLIVNHSTRQNSVILFECFLSEGDRLIRGDWGYGGDDKPPWNIGPETSLAFSPACFFDVPPDYETPDNPVFYLRFVTASGKRFTQQFERRAPRRLTSDEPLRFAA